MNKLLTVTILFFTLVSCASMKVFEMPKVQAELATAFQHTEEVTQKIREDFAEKQNVIAHLKKVNSPTFRAVEADVEVRMKMMKVSLEDMVKQKRIMSEANSQIVALSYNRTKVHSHQPEFERIEEAVKQFETATKEVNAAAQEYSNDTNSLAKTIADKKLYFNFDVAEFQQKVETHIKAAQGTQKTMQEEIERSQNLLLNWPKVGGRQPAEKVFLRMTENAQNFSTKAQKLSLISRDMNRVTMGYGKISTTESVWPQVQKLIADFDKTNLELIDLQNEFLKNHETLKASAQSRP